MRTASEGGLLPVLALAQDAIPVSAHGEGLLAWPTSFVLICLGLAVIMGGLEGPIKVKIGSSSITFIMAFFTLYKVVWFSPFGDENVNAIWNYSLVPIGVGLLAYFMMRVFGKWQVFIKSKNQGCLPGN
jgi:hypothetical protein